jgi:hypothetical protein
VTVSVSVAASAASDRSPVATSAASDHPLLVASAASDRPLAAASAGVHSTTVESVWRVAVSSLRAASDD